MPEPAQTSPSPLRVAGICLLLFGVTLLVFSRALGCNFVFFDDPEYIYRNAHVQSGLSLANIKWALTSGEACNWHPLTWMSHMLDCQIYGLNPRGHHATSVVIHAFNAVLAFLVLRRLLKIGIGSAKRPAIDLTAAIAAALFALHPLRVESVAWVSERKDVLSGFFFLLTLWSYIVYAEQRNRNEAGAWLTYIAALGAYALGLLSKPMLVTTPGVLLLLDLWPLGRATPHIQKSNTDSGRSQINSNIWPRWQTLALEKTPFLILAVASCIITYWVQKSSGAVSSFHPASMRIENAFISILRYLGTFFWPVDLCAYYPYVLDWPHWLGAAAFLFTASVTTIALWLAKRRPWLAVGWFWFLGMLVPVIGIIQVGDQSMADRYTYLPLLGLTLLGLAAWHQKTWSMKAQWQTCFVTSIILLALGMRTWNQIGFWKDSLTLHGHTLALTKNNWFATASYGASLFEAHRIEEAVPYFKESVRINPKNDGTLFAYARVLYALGRYEEACTYYKKGLELKPDDSTAATEYDSILKRPGHGAEDETTLRLTLRQQPNNAEAQNKLGTLLLQRGMFAEAEQCFRAAVQINPSDARAWVSLGATLFVQNHPSEALHCMETARTIDPTLPELDEHIAELRKQSAKGSSR